MDRLVVGKASAQSASLGQRAFHCTKFNLIRSCRLFSEKRSPTCDDCLTTRRNLHAPCFLMSAILWRGHAPKEMMSARLTESQMRFSDFWKVIEAKGSSSQQPIWIPFSTARCSGDSMKSSKCRYLQRSKLPDF